MLRRRDPRADREAQCYAGIPRITMRGTRIFTLIDQLAYFAVTPDSLNDVLQDWL